MASRSRPRSALTFLIQSLEPRTLLSGELPGPLLPPSTSGGSGAPGTLPPLTQPFTWAITSQNFTIANRQSLLAGLSLPSNVQSALSSALSSNNAASFDSQLLTYFRSRPAAGFFFNPNDIDAHVAWINGNLSISSIIQKANDALNNLISGVQLPGDINWKDTSASTSDSSFVLTLNRMNHLLDLAQASRLTGTSSYASQIVEHLSDWASEFPTLTVPSNFSDANKSGWTLVTAARLENLVWTWNLMLSSSDWSGPANSLMLYKLMQHGDFLMSATPSTLSDNRSIFRGQAMTYLANAIPEFAASSTWRTNGRNYLFGGMDAQFYDDGAHREQAPGYAQLVLQALLESKISDDAAGFFWPALYQQKLLAGMRAYVQFLNPNAQRPAIGDTNRGTSPTLYLTANRALNTSEFPAARPRVSDAWLFGPTVVSGYMDINQYPIDPTLAGIDRGRAVRLADSGNFFLRSGSDASARQIFFDAGPRGGTHGHYDLLGLELFGHNRVLLADPGYFSDPSVPAGWDISTPAHNTISINGASHGQIEDAKSNSIRVSQWDVGVNSAQVTAYHHGYGFLSGRPVVARSVWYDYDGTMLVVDWGESQSVYAYTSSFTIPGTSFNFDSNSGTIRSTFSSGGNVRVSPLLQPGQSASRTTTKINGEGGKQDASRLAITQSGSFVTFATLVNAYDGTTPPNISAEWITTSPQAGQPIQLRLTKNGVQQTVTFTPPALERLNNRATIRGYSADIEFDAAGNLHMAYYDRLSRTLKYSVRDAITNRWSIVETIDSSDKAGQTPAIAINSQGHVGVAYTDAAKGDLKYAIYNNDHWEVQTVDWKGATGYNPSLAFGRQDGAVITYYDRSRGDLRMAQPAFNGWDLITLHSEGDVGKVSSIALDPARTNATKWCIAFEDTTKTSIRYMIQGNVGGGTYNSSTGYTTFTLDNKMTKGSGHVSLAFDQQSRAAIAYYDARRTALKIVRSDRPFGSNPIFTGQEIISAGVVGEFCNVYFDHMNRPVVYFSDKTNNRTMKATQNSSGGWSSAIAAAGGREIEVARRNNKVSYVNLDWETGIMQVLNA